MQLPGMLGVVLGGSVVAVVLAGCAPGRPAQGPTAPPAATTAVTASPADGRKRRGGGRGRPPGGVAVGPAGGVSTPGGGGGRSHRTGRGRSRSRRGWRQAVLVSATAVSLARSAKRKHTRLNSAHQL